jgi:hypothetical protein
MRQCAVESLHGQACHVDIDGSDDHGAAIKHHVRPAFTHDGLKNGVESHFQLTCSVVESGLDLRLTLLDPGLKGLLLRGKVLFLLCPNIGGKDRHLLLELNGFTLQGSFFSAELRFSLFGQILRLRDHFLACGGALQNQLTIDHDDARRATALAPAGPAARVRLTQWLPRPGSSGAGKWAAPGAPADGATGATGTIAQTAMQPVPERELGPGPKDSLLDSSEQDQRQAVRNRRAQRMFDAHEFVPSFNQNDAYRRRSEWLAAPYPCLISG